MATAKKSTTKKPTNTPTNANQLQQAAGSSAQGSTLSNFLQQLQSQLGIQLGQGGQTPAAAATPPAAVPETNPDASFFLNTPQNQLGPSETPSAWSLDSTSENAPLYAGPGPGQAPTSVLKTNAILGKIADALGVSASVKGKSTLEQVTEALASHLGIKSELPGQSVLAQVAERLGVQFSTAQTLSAQSAQNILSGKPGANKPIAPSDNQLVFLIANAMGVPTTGTKTTADQTTTLLQAAQSIYTMNPDQISALQAQLYSAGFYDQAVYDPNSTAVKSITPGNLDPYTMKAFGIMLKGAATNYAAGKAQTWQDYLGTAAGASGTYTPGETAQAAFAGGAGDAQQQALKRITVATQPQVQSTVQQYFEQELGRKPTQAEIAQFTSQLDTLENEKIINADPSALLFPDTMTGVATIPGVPTVASAAEQFAKSNPMEYAGHQFANAGALLLNAMKAAGSGVGGNPNVTNAG